MLLVSSTNKHKWLFNKANTQSTKTLIYGIKKVTLAPLRGCAGLRSLTELFVWVWHSNKLLFRAVLNQEMHQKMPPLSANVFSTQCAAATENVTCCHHAFKIWPSGPEFSETGDFVKGFSLHICSGYLPCWRLHFWPFQTIITNNFRSNAWFVSTNPCCFFAIFVSWNKIISK